MVSSPNIIRASSDPIITPYLTLLELWPMRYPEGIQRFVVNNEKIISNGVTYNKSYFEVSHPDGTDGDVSISITVSNIDRVPGQTLIAETDIIICRIILINSVEFDNILRDTHDLFYLSGGVVDARVVTSLLASRIEPMRPIYEGANEYALPAIM